MTIAHTLSDEQLIPFPEVSPMSSRNPTGHPSANILGVVEMHGILRIVRQLRDLPPDPILRRRHLLAKLCKLLGASAGISVVLDWRQKSAQKRIASAVHVGLSSPAKRKLLDRWLATLQPHDPACIALARVMLHRAEPMTFHRHDLVNDRTWYDSTHVRNIRTPLGVGDCLYSSFPIDGTPLSGLLCLARPCNARHPFESRHRDMLHLLHSEVDWLYREEPTPTHHDLSELTPRQRQSLQCLLDGNSEKQIATRLGLSRHTVHVHVKALYRQMRVNSRGELMARFVPR